MQAPKTERTAQTEAQGNTTTTQPMDGTHGPGCLRLDTSVSFTRRIPQLYVPNGQGTQSPRRRHLTQLGHVWLPNMNRAQLDKGRNVGSGRAGPPSISDHARSHQAFCRGNKRKTLYEPGLPGALGRHQRQPTPTAKNIPYSGHSTQVQGLQIDLRPLLCRGATAVPINRLYYGNNNKQTIRGVKCGQPGRNGWWQCWAPWIPSLQTNLSEH